MGEILPNMSIYVPSPGETNYADSFLLGMQNVDAHDHSGGSNNGVQISATGIQNGAITRDKLNNNVIATGEGLAFDGNHAIIADGLLNSIYKLSSTGLIARTGVGTSAARTITGTSNQIAVANGNGVSGNPTLSLSPIVSLATQPYVEAYRNSDVTNFTGNSVEATVVFDTVDFDTQSIYNSTTGEVTIATDGVYFVNVLVMIINAGASHTTSNIKLVKNGSPYIQYQQNPDVIKDGSNQVSYSLQSCLICAPADVLKITLTVAGGAQDVTLSGSNTRTLFQLIKVW